MRKPRFQGCQEAKSNGRRRNQGCDRRVRFHNVSAESRRQVPMSFPWPVTDDELVLDEALDIALCYFEQPQDEAQYAIVESFAGEAIMAEWRRGVRNKVVLANKAIAEIEEHHPLRKKLSPVS